MHKFAEMSTQIEALLSEPMWTFIPKVNLLEVETVAFIFKSLTRQ